MSNEDAIEMIDILKDNWYLPKNIKSEIAAQWYLLWLENKNAWYSFLAWFYPSKAWEIEQILELLRQKATSRDIERYINSLKAKEIWTQWVWTIAEMPQLSDAWKNMQRTVWFGAWEIDLPNRESASNQTPEMWADYDARYRQKYWKNM